MVGNYKVITLCGSTRFKKEFMEAQKNLTLQKNIVISVGLFGHSGDEEVWENMDEGTLTQTKEMLDDMHKRKIDMADEIFVINVGGYIGDSTRSEIEYARKMGKKVNYLEPIFQKEENRIYLEDEEGKLLGEINFEKVDNDSYNIYHTFVDESMRGQKLASQLVQEAVKEIEKKGAKVVASCSYAKAWLEKNKKRSSENEG